MKMNRNGMSGECGMNDEIVSYIYDEIDHASRRQFENHIAVCGNCADEFAVISGARFSIFEWQREAFAPLSTPEIAIPYDRAIVGIKNSPSYIDMIRGWFSHPGFAGAAAVLILGLTIGLILAEFGKEQPQVADESTPVEVQTPSSTIQDIPSEMAATDFSGEDKAERDNKPIQAATVSNKRKPVLSNRVRSRTPPRANSVQARRSPVLTDFEDTTDRSLRLADLVDDGGDSSILR